MLTGAGLCRQSRRLVGRVHDNGPSLAALAIAANRLARHDGSSDSSKRTCRGDLRPPQHLLQAQTLHVPALQQRGHRSSSITRLGGDGGTIGVAAFGGGRGLDLAAWRGAAAAGGTVGARRSFGGRSGDGFRAGSNGNSNGSGSGSGSGREDSAGFPETGGAADADGWSAPPDAWMPDEPPAEIPQDASMPGFDAGEGFSVDSAAAALDAVAGAAPDASAIGTAMTATGLSAADLGMYPHHLFMHMIDYVQATAGVPYWEAIVMVSVAARIVVLPAVATFLGMSKRLNMIKPEMAVHQGKMQDIKNRMEANPEVKEAAMAEMMLVSQEMGNLLKQHRIHFPKMMLSMFAQFPVFISLFLATRDMGMYFPGYMTGGLDWMVNLSAPDPTWTLPILTSGSMILLMELGSDMPAAHGPDKPNFNPKVMFRVMSIVFVPVAFSMPAGVLVYWTTTNVFGMLQRGLFEMRPVQQALGWPLPEDMPAPAAPADKKEPAEADFASKEDLERWGGGGKGASGEASRAAAEAAERAREAVAKASKVRHEELKRQHGERNREDGPK
ncbi:unnamed protein product [Ectocarpus sp. CCAP 1310/34]|nr:unnamed protein product [Ectocarpus sp. CCAP 1310/34]